MLAPLLALDLLGPEFFLRELADRLLLLLSSLEMVALLLSLALDSDLLETDCLLLLLRSLETLGLLPSSTSGSDLLAAELLATRR